MTAYDETRIAELLRLIPPAPERWVAEAKALPRTRDELDRMLSTIGQDDSEQEEERFGEDFDPGDRLVGSASGGRGNDDVEGHMNEYENEQDSTDLEPDVEGQSHRGPREDEGLDDDVEGHIHRGPREDEDLDDDVEGHIHRGPREDEGSDEEDV